MLALSLKERSGDTVVSYILWVVLKTSIIPPRKRLHEKMRSTGADVADEHMMRLSSLNDQGLSLGPRPRPGPRTWPSSQGLHSIYPTVGIVKHSKNISRYDSVLLNRLRIGHSRLTHSYLLSGDDSPTCQSCRIPLTVKHILVECANLRDIREKYFTVSSLAGCWVGFNVPLNTL